MKTFLLLIFTALQLAAQPFYTINPPFTQFGSNLVNQPDANAVRSLIGAASGSFDNVAQMVASSISVSTNLVSVKGYYTPGDGGGGFFVLTNTASGTNFGKRLASATPFYSWDRIDAPPINVRQFGAKGDGSTDDTARIQNAIDLVAASGAGQINIPYGAYRVTSLNLQHSDLAIVGEVGLNRTVICGGTNGYPMFDCAGAQRITLKDLYFESTNNYPSCAILLGRTGTGSAGSHHLERIRVDGQFSIAGVFTLASEENNFFACDFMNAPYVQSALTNARTTFYSAKTATNIYSTPVVSLFNAITADGAGGNGLNRFYGCSFVNHSTNVFGTALVAEYSQNTSLYSCYWYTGGGTNQIWLGKSAFGFATYHCTGEFTAPQPIGIWLASADVFQDFQIDGICFPIHGTNGAILDNVRIEGTMALPSTGYGISVDYLYNAFVRTSNREIFGIGSNVFFNARLDARNCEFVDIPMSRLSLAGTNRIVAYQNRAYMGKFVVGQTNLSVGAADDAQVYGNNSTVLDLYQTANLSILTTNAVASNLGGSLMLGGVVIDNAYPGNIDQHYNFGGLKAGKDNSNQGDISGYLSLLTSKAGVGTVERMRIDKDGNAAIWNLSASKAVFTDANTNLTSTGTLGTAQGGTGTSSAGTQYGVPYYATTTSFGSTAAGTTTTLLHGNASGAPTFGAVSLTADVSGTLGVSNGGTGAGAFTQGSVVFAGASGVYTESPSQFRWETSGTPGGLAGLTISNGMARLTNSSLQITRTAASSNNKHWNVGIGSGNSLEFKIYNDDISGPIVAGEMQRSGVTPGSFLWNGDIAAATVGKGFQVKEGSNAKMGTVALVNGTATVSTTAVTASSRIFLTRQTGSGTTRGILGLGTVTASTSFVIRSEDLSGNLSSDDDSTVAWILIEPAP